MFLVEILTLVPNLSQCYLFVVQKLSLRKEVQNKLEILTRVCINLLIYLQTLNYPVSLGKIIDQTLKECKKSGSVPPDVMKRVVRQVVDHIEAEKPKPSKTNIEWVAWTYCLKYPGLKTTNPLEIFGGNVESNTKSFN